MDFKGKTLVASGAASGMGLLCCKKFVEAGGYAVMADINEESLNAALKEVNAIRENSAIGVVCDVRDYKQICNVRDAAVKAFGRIDLLVPFAGGAEIRMLKVDRELEFPDIPIEVYDWSLDVNLRSQLYFDHACLSVMREQKSGVIVHIGSITGSEGSPNNVGYATSKSAAMSGLTKSIAQFGAKYGIRCCSVAPGPVLTRPGMANMKTMLDRAAEPEEIVDFILYIASDKGAFFNGTNVMLDGGREAMPRK